jgi:hypothetical protein
MRRLRFLSCALGVILVGSVGLWASINGSISGVVTDSSGAVVSGATVTATNVQTGVKTTLETDSKGLNNWDMTLSKVTKITESKELELRVEAFNLFNHAQFTNPDGGIDSGPPSFVNGVNQGGTFGLVTSARNPRILQLGARFTF